MAFDTRRVERVEGASTAEVVFSGGTSVAEYAGSSGASSSPAVEFIRGSDWGGGVGGILYSVRGASTRFEHYDARGDVATQTRVPLTDAVCSL